MRPNTQPAQQTLTANIPIFKKCGTKQRTNTDGERSSKKFVGINLRVKLKGCVTFSSAIYPPTLYLFLSESKILMNSCPTIFLTVSTKPYIYVSKITLQSFERNHLPCSHPARPFPKYCLPKAANNVPGFYYLTVLELQEKEGLPFPPFLCYCFSAFVSSFPMSVDLCPRHFVCWRRDCWPSSQRFKR